MARVKLGLIGCGFMGQLAHLRNYVEIDDCQIAALAEMRQQIAEKVAAKYSIDQLYNDHHQMLEFEKLDGVIASQPFDRHALLLEDVYPKVKFVFTEKPIAVSLCNAEKLAKSAGENGCTHMVGYHKRSDPASQYAKNVIDDWKISGKAGQMKYVRISMPEGDWVANGKRGLISTDESYPQVERETYQGDIPEQYVDEYVLFINYFIHQINFMRYILGESYTVTYCDKSSVLMATESKSGVSGIIEMTPYKTSIGWDEEILVAFEKGYIKLRLPAPLTINRAGTVEVFEDFGDGCPKTTVPTMPWVDAMQQQAVNFIEVCKGNMPPPCDADEAVEDLKIARDYIIMKNNC